MPEKPPKYEHFNDSDDTWEFNFDQHDILNPEETLDKISKSIVNKQPVDLTSISKNQGVINTIRATFSGLYRIDDPPAKTPNTSSQTEVVGAIVDEDSDENGEPIIVTFTADENGKLSGRFFRIA